MRGSIRMKVIGKYPGYRLTKKWSVTVLVLLVFSSFISNNEMYVVCLEGNGQITIEKQHYNGTNPFINNSSQASRLPLPHNKKCHNTRHISFADISSADRTCFDIDLEPPQFLQDSVQPSTEYFFNKEIAFTSFHDHPSTANQRIKAIRSTVLLI